MSPISEMYSGGVPKLWSDTIETHRHEVRDAILESTATLAASRGPFNVTMSEIAQDVGIGRATLYKYFPGVEQILDAWHERHIANHLEHLKGEAAADRPPMDRLKTVLTSYAQVVQRRGSHAGETYAIEMTSFLHRPDGAARTAAAEVHELITRLISHAVESGDVRSDTTPDELAHFCLHALNAATHFKSKAATERLIEFVVTGLRS